MPSFDINKATEKAKFTLAKKGVPDVRCQVAIMMDISGSTGGLYRAGLMQSAFQVALPVANVVDLNKEMDVYTFADGSSIRHIDEPATLANFSDYVQRQIVARGIGGGTSYAPVLEQALRDFGFYAKKGGFFGGGREQLTARSSKGDPVLVYFMTDGENDDKDATTALFQAMADAKSAFYVNFVGIGRGTDFAFIKKLADRFPNVGFAAAADVEKFAGSDDVYEQLIPTEFTEWLKTSLAAV